MDLTYLQIANNLDYWLEYICGDKEAKINTNLFYSLTVEERINYITENYGVELVGYEND